MKVLQWIGARAKERSTWLGLMGILAGVGISLRPELQEAIVALGAALGGLIAIITGEK